MTCETLRETVQKTLDARADIPWGDDARAHAESCPECRRFLESLLALHEALQNLPRVSARPELIASLNRINQPEFVPAKIGWGPEIRLGAALLLPALLPYVAQAFSFDKLQHVLEALMLLLGLTIFGIAAMKPLFLGRPERRIVLEKG